MDSKAILQAGVLLVLVVTVSGQSCSQFCSQCPHADFGICSSGSCCLGPDQSGPSNPSNCLNCAGGYTMCLAGSVCGGGGGGGVPGGAGGGGPSANSGGKQVQSLAIGIVVVIIVGSLLGVVGTVLLIVWAVKNNRRPAAVPQYYPVPGSMAPDPAQQQVCASRPVRSCWWWSCWWWSRCCPWWRWR
eukprot:m.231495 g.231495  ORF g.231495 m.231495 type:complete len:187 (-) comp26030_c0_seq51:47-607(-)